MTGVFVGLLVGLLISLSVSPVVGTFVGALTTLLTVFLGLEGTSFLRRDRQTSTEFDRLKAWRIVGFVVGCIASILTGLYARTHNALGLSPAEVVAEWRSAGFPDDVARKIALARLVGNDAGQGAKDSAATRSTLSALFAVPEDKSFKIPRRLAPEYYAGPQAWAVAFSLENGALGELGRAVLETKDEKVQRDILNAVWKLMSSD